MTKLFVRLVSFNQPRFRKQVLINLGQSSIQSQCPVCDHSPLTPDLCKPSKAVRTTAKAYLKTAEKKLADERLKAEAAAGQAEAPTPTKATLSPVQDVKKEEPRASSKSLGRPETTRVEVKQDIVDQPQPSVEVRQRQSTRGGT